MTTSTLDSVSQKWSECVVTFLPKKVASPPIGVASLQVITFPFQKVVRGATDFKPAGVVTLCAFP